VSNMLDDRIDLCTKDMACKYATAVVIDTASCSRASSGCAGLVSAVALGKSLRRDQGNVFGSGGFLKIFAW
jgi:hypothetical protein